MTEKEVSLLLAKASAAFRNSAPNFKENPGIFKLWCEMLQGIDAQRALSNLNIYILNNKFFPDISDVVRNDLISVADHEQKRLATSDMLMLKESWLDTSTPPPIHIKERWGKQ